MPCVFVAYEAVAARKSTSSSTVTQNTTVRLPLNSTILAYYTGGEYRRASSGTSTYTNYVGANDRYAGNGAGQNIVTPTITNATTYKELKFTHSNTESGSGSYGTHLSVDIILFTVPGFNMFINADGKSDVIANNTVTEIPSGTMFPRTTINRLDFSESQITEMPYYFCEYNSIKHLSFNDLVLPSTCTIIRSGTLIGIKRTLDMSRATAVIALNDYSYSGIDGLQILVPAALYDQWIAAANWSRLASYIVAV